MRLLIVRHTHGDEIDPVVDSRDADVITANQLARDRWLSMVKQDGPVEARRRYIASRGREGRYIASDLNRAFNGHFRDHEEQRAQQLVELMRPYDLVIDVHSTITGRTSAVISTHNSTLEQEAAYYLMADHYVYMPEMRTSLIHHARNGLALELGGEEDSVLYQDAIHNLANWFHGRPNRVISHDHKTWRCIGYQQKAPGQVTRLTNYDSLVIGDTICENEDGGKIATLSPFTTFLWGNDQYEDIFGFKLVPLH